MDVMSDCFIGVRLVKQLEWVVLKLQYTGKTITPVATGGAEWKLVLVNQNAMGLNLNDLLDGNHSFFGYCGTVKTSNAWTPPMYLLVL